MATNKLTYSFVMTDAQVEKAIPSLTKRTAALRADMHKVAVSILANWAKHGDVATAVRRASAMLTINDDYAQKVVNWFGLYAGFELDEENGGFVYDDTRTTISADQVKAAKAETMFDLTPPKPVKPFNLPERIQSLINAAEKRRKKGVTEGDEIPQEMLNKLKSALS